MDEVTVNGLDSKCCEDKDNGVHHSETQESIHKTNDVEGARLAHSCLIQVHKRCFTKFLF